MGGAGHGRGPDQQIVARVLGRAEEIARDRPGRVPAGALRPAARGADLAAARVRRQAAGGAGQAGNGRTGRGGGGAADRAPAPARGNRGPGGAGRDGGPAAALARHPGCTSPGDAGRGGVPGTSPSTAGWTGPGWTCGPAIPTPTWPPRTRCCTTRSTPAALSTTGSSQRCSHGTPRRTPPRAACCWSRTCWPGWSGRSSTPGSACCCSSSTAWVWRPAPSWCSR